MRCTCGHSDTFHEGVITFDSHNLGACENCDICRFFEPDPHLRSMGRRTTDGIAKARASGVNLGRLKMPLDIARARQKLLLMSDPKVIQAMRLRCEEERHEYENCCSAFFRVYQKCKWCGEER